MNNSVKNGYGEVIGFRCWTCGGVFSSMWGETCNRCRVEESENAKLRNEVRELTKAIKELKNRE